MFQHLWVELDHQEDYDVTLKLSKSQVSRISNKI